MYWFQVCECVVILRGIKDVSWKGAKAMMADNRFLATLMEFDKDAIGDKQVDLTFFNSNFEAWQFIHAYTIKYD